MHKRPTASHRASSIQATSLSVRRKTQPHTAHLSLSTTHRRKHDFAITHVTNCETPLSVKDPHEDDAALVQVVSPSNTTSPSMEGISFEGTPLGAKLEKMISVMWMCTAIMSCSFFILTGVYHWIDAMTEWQMLLTASIPFVWNWYCRLRAFKWKWGIATGIFLRVLIMFFMLTTNVYQIRTFIFLYDRAILAVAGVATGVTLVAHWLLRSNTNPVPFELRKLDTDSVASFLSDDPESVKKEALRISMIWVFISGVLVIPFVQEIMFRGVVAISFGHASSAIVASMSAAMVSQLNQPVESVRGLFGALATHTVWGLLIMMTTGNLMYSYVAHMMHNAVLLGVYHYDSLIDSW